MRKISKARGALPFLLLLAGLMLLAQPLLADSVTYLYETRAVGELEPCG